MNNHLFSDNSTGLNFVAIGGGNGLSTLLSGLKTFVGEKRDEKFHLADLAAIVAVTDDGGSSGRLRDELQMLPPGDIRNCMVALSEDSLLLSKLFRYRFRGQGELGGHSFGNLFLAALTEVTGDFAEAVKLSSEILASKGRIFPATIENARLGGELKDGRTIHGETNISKFGSEIKGLRLEPETCHPLPEMLAAIEKADVISVGPGSLFTSLIPPILVKGVPDAIALSKAAKIFICNLMTQPGETEGFSAEKHLETFREYAPQIKFDYVIVNNRPISDEQAARYHDEGAEQIGLRYSALTEIYGGAQIVGSDLLEESAMVRHHPQKLAQAVLSCAEIRQPDLLALTPVSELVV